MKIAILQDKKGFKLMQEVLTFAPIYRVVDVGGLSVILADDQKLPHAPPPDQVIEFIPVGSAITIAGGVVALNYRQI